MIIILTKPPGFSPFNKEWVKYYASKITRRRRGPEMVALSLSRGLTKLGVQHRLNPFFVSADLRKNSIVHVINGAETLKWALGEKLSWQMKKLIVGPAISVVPEDNNFILNDPLIDTIVFPGQWTKDFFSSIDPYFKNKIEVWPAGVRADVKTSNRKNGHGIVFAKFAPQELRDEVAHTLSEKDITYETFEYGQFRQADYYKALEKADWLIYLSPSESQGIALQEAWIRDVPTLVWSPGVWNYKTYSWKDAFISAPYLNPKSGRLFEETADFKRSLESFMQDLPSFTPRNYCLESLTDVKSAERFLEIIEQK